MTLNKILKYTLFLFFFFSFHYLAAQEFNEKAAKKTLKAKEVEMLDPDWSVIKARSRKNKKWGVFQWNGVDESAKEIVPFILDSLSSWFPQFEPFIVVKNNGKYDMLLNPYEIQDAAERLKFEYDRILYKEEGFESYAVVQKNGKWGLVDWFDGFVVHPFVEDAPEDVPLISLPEWKKSLISTTRKELNADLIIFDGSGDGVFKARHSTSEKWGMFQAEGETVSEIIPMKYDSLNFFGYNDLVNEVYNDGKVGFYIFEGPFQPARASVPCIYDDFQLFSVEKPDEYGYATMVTKEYMGIKKGGKWGWIDHYTGEEKTEFKYDSKEDLPYPNW